MNVFLKVLCRTGLAVVSIVVGGDVHAATEVKFSDLFAGAALGDDVIVQVPDNATLVFDGPAPYVLEGKNLLVRARKAVIRGTLRIEAYSDTNVGPSSAGTPPTPGVAAAGSEGASGVPGDEGKSGAAAGVCLLDIGTLQAEPGAKLLVRFTGQIGGAGQKGGQGAQGGAGPTGRDASNSALCDRPCPDAGGVGFPGGARGSGGKGGLGGRGGVVYLSKAVAAAQGPSAVLIDISGGAGGAPGPLGERGIGGIGGARGKGSSGCQCKDVPGPGPEGPAGPDSAAPTPVSEAGEPGAVKEI